MDTYLNKKVNILLFLFLYFIYGFKVIIASVQLPDDFLEPTKTFLNIFALAIVMVAFFYINIKERVAIILVCVWMVINYILFNNYNLYDYVILGTLIFLCRKIMYSDTLKALFYSNFCILLSIIPFLLISDRAYIQDIKSGLRLTYGFIHPNVVAQYFVSLFFIFCAYSFYKFKGIAIKFILLLTFYCILVFLILPTQSRTSIIVITVSALLVLFYLWDDNMKNIPLIRKYAIVLIVLVMLTFQLLGSIYFRDYSWLYLVDYVLSGRLYQGNQLYQDFGFPPLFFGRNIQNYMPIDFYFIGTMYSVGFIFTILITSYLFYLVSKSKIDGPMFVIVLTNLLTMFTEFHFQIPIYSTALFILASRKNN
ncbi:TPA: hypothetical protein RQ363_004711 [Klebsiella oxytoca]|nr:hypothetical protein [Klebsiella oxytoca]HDY3614301.1 hypothetical protein [Klebsiella oxytoca]